jgi:hypothetical protein
MCASVNLKTDAWTYNVHGGRQEIAPVRAVVAGISSLFDMMNHVIIRTRECSIFPMGNCNPIGFYSSNSQKRTWEFSA